MDGGFLLMKCVKIQMNGKADLFKNHGLTFINLLIYKMLMNVKMRADCIIKDFGSTGEWWLLFQQQVAAPYI
jgi:hypothetical protein